MSRVKKIEIALISLFILALVGALKMQSPTAWAFWSVSRDFGINIIKVLPCAFVLIGMFEVWVKKETVERHFGQQSGLMGHVWGILLAGTTVGGLYVAFPVSAALYHNGARQAVIFSYIGAAAIVRIPMTIFEASFLGLKFSLIRLLVSIPLVILSAEIMGRALQKKGSIIHE